MADENRAQAQALKLFEELQARPWSHGLYATLRAIECLYPDRPRLGESRRAKDDPLRLGQEPTLAFSPSELANFHPPADGKPARLNVYSLGLFGPNAPLPLHLTDYVRQRERNSDDPTFRRFVDIFHHRLISLFYRAWANAQPTVSLDRPAADRFSRYVGALMGIGLPALRTRDSLPDAAKLFHVGQFAGQTRTAEGLEQIVADYFRVPVRVRQFMGEWLPLPEESFLLLGRSTLTGALGQTAVLGKSVWSRQHRFRVVLGPLGVDDFRRLLPGTDNLRRLESVVRLYVGGEQSWDLQLLLRRNEVPPLILGRQGDLGRTSWLNVDWREADADDAVLHPSPHLSNAA